MTNPALRYRPEIDGLRAVAVVPVVLFHAGFALFQGGFVGVDIFFVISGYLITTIILRECQDSHFSIRRFYERRARRILPALFLVMAVSLPVAAFIMLPSDFGGYGASIAATALFASNILFWRERGYFETAAELKPMLHTWSLAVEEQYYIFFPLAVVVLWRLGRRSVFGAIALATLASFLLSDWASTRLIAANFFLVPFRAWELFAGSLTAIWLLNREPPKGAAAATGGIAGLALLALGIFAVDETVPFPGRAALLPVVGTALVILFARPTNLAGRLLALKPMVAIGLVSYSAYLWHQPIFAFTRLTALNHPGKWLMLSLSLLAFVLAWASWRYVEGPFRDHKRISAGTIWKLSAGGIAAFLAAGIAIYFSGGFPQRFGPEIRHLIAVHDNPSRGREGCVDDPSLPIGGCMFNAGEPQRAHLWGDSHAMALAEDLADELGRRGIALETGTSSGCPAIPRVIRPGNECASGSADVLAYLLSPASPQIVILHSRWAAYFEATKFDNLEGGVEVGAAIYLDHADSPASDEPQARWLTRELRTAIGQLEAAGKKIVFVGTVPEAGWHVSANLIRRRIIGLQHDGPLSIASETFERRNAQVEAAIAPFRDDPAVSIVEPADLFCDTQLADRCILDEDGEPLYRDGDHLSHYGASLLAVPVAEAVAEAAAETERP